MSNLSLQDITFENTSPLCDVSQCHPRQILPREWTYRAFQLVHSLAHTGPRPIQRAIAKQFVWHGMQKGVRQWCKECHQCHASKIHRYVGAPLVTGMPPSGRFRSLHLNLVGPLPTSESMTYLLAIIDRYTRWPELINRYLFAVTSKHKHNKYEDKKKKYKTAGRRRVDLSVI